MDADKSIDTGSLPPFLSLDEHNNIKWDHAKVMAYVKEHGGDDYLLLKPFEDCLTLIPFYRLDPIRVVILNVSDGSVKYKVKYTRNNNIYIASIDGQKSDPKQFAVLTPLSRIKNPGTLVNVFGQPSYYDTKTAETKTGTAQNIPVVTTLNEFETLDKKTLDELEQNNNGKLRPREMGGLFALRQTFCVSFDGIDSGDASLQAMFAEWHRLLLKSFSALTNETCIDEVPRSMWVKYGMFQPNYSSISIEDHVVRELDCFKAVLSEQHFHLNEQFIRLYASTLHSLSKDEAYLLDFCPFPIYEMVKSGNGSTETKPLRYNWGDTNSIIHNLCDAKVLPALRIIMSLDIKSRTYKPAHRAATKMALIMCIPGHKGEASFNVSMEGVPDKYVSSNKRPMLSITYEQDEDEPDSKKVKEVPLNDEPARFDDYASQWD